jgi:prepilin-type N-terminal cleavage/methylation domain-containing protein
MYRHKKNKKRGFTLIEMLVSIAIFTIVVTIVMGTIVTIVDISRKTRTMTEAMSNLNLVMESMTRTLKTSTTIYTDITNSPYGKVTAIDQSGKTIIYSVATNTNNNKKGILKTVDGVDELITSDDIEIVGYAIQTFPYNEQPRVMISLKGRVETAKGIYSEFILQTSVAQRQLKL